MVPWRRGESSCFPGLPLRVGCHGFTLLQAVKSSRERPYLGLSVRAQSGPAPGVGLTSAFSLQTPALQKGEELLEA